MYVRVIDPEIEGYKQSLRAFSGCTCCAVLLAIVASSINVLAIQRSRDTSDYQNYNILYHWDSVGYTYEYDGELYEYNYKYADAVDYMDKTNCPESIYGAGEADAETVCDDMERLKNGGETYVGCVSAGIVILFVANIISILWSMDCRMNTICFWTHWLISIGCTLAAIFFWSGFGAWQTAFDNNAVVDNISDVLAVTTTVKSLNSAEVYEPKLGTSATMLIIAAVCSIFACCYSVDFSRKRRAIGTHSQLHASL